MLIEQPDILSKYKIRPEELEQILYTHFGYFFASGEKFRPAETGTDEDDGIDLDKRAEGNKFNYLITEKDSQRAERPEMIQLQSPMPKEIPFMHRRKFPAAIQFHKTNRHNNLYKFFSAELMTYVPFRDENEFMHRDDKEIERIYAEK